jgi:hypothetical protein
VHEDAAARTGVLLHPDRSDGGRRCVGALVQQPQAERDDQREAGDPGNELAERWFGHTRIVARGV